MRYKICLAIMVIALMMMAAASVCVYAELPDLIPRSVFFGNPVKASARIAPDGLKLAYLAPSDKDVLNVWVQTIGKEDATIVTNDKHRGIRIYFWTMDSKYIIYLQDSDGDENWHAYLTNLETKIVRDLTPFQGIRAQGIMIDKHFPNEILVGLNLRDKRVFDMYRINLTTGAVIRDTENPGDVVGWMTDAQFVIRGAIAMDQNDGGQFIRVRESKDKPWRDFMKFPFGESGDPLDFSADGKAIYISSSLGFDTQRLVKFDVETGKELAVIAYDPRCDIGDVVIHQDTHEPQAIQFDYLKPEWHVIDQSLTADFEALKKNHPGVFFISSKDLDDKNWIVGYYVDDGPVVYYAYNREKKAATFLFENRPDLNKYKLAKTEPVIIQSRDKKNLVSYLTLPIGLEPKNLPMVLLVHGGPWGRDSWGYDGEVQMLANRGYAVLQTNFRASSGFGKKFLNAGNMQWGADMQNDLTDAVKWAIKKGYADPKRIAIMGGSYGGYATLAGLTFTPELYACGVDIVGPSNIKTLFQSIPPYWAPLKKMFVLRVGDAENDEAINKKISPLFHVDKIRVPLLIGQGANDPRVNIRESDQIVKAMRDKKLEVKYVVYTDEGHGFARPDNNMDFYGYVDEFLSSCLKGRFEPYKKTEGSTGEVR